MDELIEKLKDGKKLVIHECSMCGYPCGYSWIDGQWMYDTGCDCTYGRGGFEPRGIDGIREFVEMNSEYAAKAVKELA